LNDLERRNGPYRVVDLWNNLPNDVIST